MYPESCIILSHCPTTISDGGSQINKLAAVVVHTVVDHHGRLLEDIKPLYFAVAVLSFLCCCKTTDGGCGCLGRSVAGMGFVPVTTVLARVTCVEDVTGRGLSPMNLLGTKVLETEM